MWWVARYTCVTGMRITCGGIISPQRSNRVSQRARAPRAAIASQLHLPAPQKPQSDGRRDRDQVCLFAADHGRVRRGIESALPALLPQERDAIFAGTAIATYRLA